MGANTNMMLAAGGAALLAVGAVALAFLRRKN
jgi:LPXTG-motif cell wall-anchored protein